METPVSYFSFKAGKQTDLDGLDHTKTGLISASYSIRM